MPSSRDVMKNRMFSLTGDPSVLTQVQEPPQEESLDFDLPVVIFPEWNDADIAAEKWTTKIQFEDSDTIIFPRSLRGKFDHYKKPTELVVDGQSPVIMQSQPIQDEIFHGNSTLKGQSVGFFSSAHAFEFSSAPSDALLQHSSSEMGISRNDVGKSEMNIAAQITPVPSAGPSMVNISEKEKQPSVSNVDSGENTDPLSKTSKLFQANRHLLHSRMMMHLLSIFHFIYDQGKPTKQAPGEEFCLWDCIYPKGKDGLPTYNPSGRYAVKLFWLGSWKKIIVDDRIPCSVDGKPIVISSPLISELWPVLITKAILKIAVYSYKETSEFPEHGDFDVLYALKGMFPETLRLESDSSKFWNYLKSLPLKSNNQISNASRSSSPIRDRLAPIIPARSSSSPKSDLPVIIFSYRDRQNIENESDIPDLKTMGFYFRIFDSKELEPSNDGEIESSKYLRIRGYFSCGIRMGKMLTPAPTKRRANAEVDTDAIDTWITFDEFLYLFSDVIIYHHASSFKNIKIYQSINDPVKANDTYRISPVIASLEDSKEAEILINISTFGRANYQSTTLSVEPYSWILSESHTPVIQTSTNAVKTVLLKIPNKEIGYRFVVDCLTSYCVTFLSKDEFVLEDEAKYLQENLKAAVKDYEESYVAQPAGFWTILFKQILHFSEPIYLSANLHLADNAQPYGALKIINNDDYSLLPNAFYYYKGDYYYPNTNGYTLIAELKTPFARSPGKFKIRLISQNPILPPPEKPLDVWTKGVVQDFEEVYVKNKHNIIFRYALKIKDGLFNPASLQVSFSIPHLMIKLQLFDLDNLILSVSGRGVVTIPLYLFQPSEDQSNKPAEKTKDDKANSAREKNIISQGSARASIQRHKYILQASIDQPHYFNASASLSNSTRTSSRGMSKIGGVTMDKSSPSRKNRKSNGANSTDEKTSLPSAAAEVTCKLRIVSSDTSSMIVTKDTEKEDRYRAMKESWESSQPGRSQRATEIRDAYVKSVDIKAIQPIFMTANPSSDIKYKPWNRLNSRPGSSESAELDPSISIRKIPYLDEDGWSRIQSERESKLRLALDEIATIKSKRKNEKDDRISENKLKDLLSALSTEFEALYNIDLGKRSEYRSRVLLEAEEVAKAIEAARNAEIAAAGITEDGDKKKKGKK